MKLLFALFSCSLTIATYGQNLNGLIVKSQKTAVQTSPYYDAHHRFSVHEEQSKFRLDKFPISISQFLSDKIPLTDTLWIVESFDDMFSTGPNYSSEILYKDSLYYYNEIDNDTVSQKRFATSIFSTSKKKFILSEIVDSVRHGANKWLLHPLIYGSDRCGDGDHSLITIIYPNRTIESIYVRCWTSSDYRTKE